MANRRYIDFPIASSVGDSDIILIWQSGANKQTTKATFLSGLPENLDELNDVAISGLTNGQILRYDSVTGKWENTDQGNLDLNDLNDVSIVSPSNGQVLVYNSSTSRWENSSGGYVPYTGAVTTVNLGAQTIQAGSFVKAGGTAAQFLKADGSVDSNTYGTGTVTSVALTMPSAFTVGGSPITTAGTLAVTGAGTVGQYIRGDGSLADFPESSGGGSSVSYYLNGSVAQGTIGGVAYKELNKVPVLGAGTDFTINADGYIASFITDAGDPNLLEIPAGNWNFETYFSASSNGGSPRFYVELYKVNSGGTATLIASNSTFPELIAFGTNVISYFSTLAVPTTALALTDRLAIRYYVIHSGRTITLHTEDNHLCQIITTFTTGITALNGLTAQVQNFAVGTSGTDFAIASATATHTFNLPTASATNRGALSSADWTTFNNKTSNLGTVTSVGLSSATSGVTIGSTPVTTSGTITLAIATASGSQNGLLSSTDWSTFNGKQNALTNPVTGTGTTNYLPKFTGASTIGNSQIFDDGTNVGIGTATPTSFGAGYTVASINGSSGGGVLDLMVNTTRVLTLAVDGSLPSISSRVSGFPIVLRTNNGGTVDERFRIFSDGNVLIQSGGTFTNNGARLQVSGTATISGNVGIGGNTSTNRLQVLASNTGTQITTIPIAKYINTGNSFSKFIIGSDNANYDAVISMDNNATLANTKLRFYIGNGEASTAGHSNDQIVLQGNGNVGIGTASPEELLELSSSNSTGGQLLIESTGSSTGNYAGMRFKVAGGSDGGYEKAGIFAIRGAGGFADLSLIFAINTVSDATNVTSANEHMRITSGGNVGIGVTNPTKKLEVAASVSGQVVNISNERNNSSGDYAFVTLLGSNCSNLNSYHYIASTGGADKFYIYGNGVYATVSDIRLKKNIESVTDKFLEKLMDLNVVNYNWNEQEDGHTKEFGLIAQEVEKSFPFIVNENRPTQKGEIFKNISVSALPYILIKAIQELKQEIDTLKN